MPGSIIGDVDLAGVEAWLRLSRHAAVLQLEVRLGKH